MNADAMVRTVFILSGRVQGVGMRPFVKRLADQNALTGFVCNQQASVWIEVEGREQSIARFSQSLWNEMPSLARVDHWESAPAEPRGERSFQIQPSVDDANPSITVLPDLATCEDCLRELFDPADRRFSYPFINCTRCGPRFTIIRAVPYDRVRTTMDEFVMCGRCRREYEDPNDRRFHAQPIACPDCGPRLQLVGADGLPLEIDDPLVEFADNIGEGQIGALKGLGGFHLVCDAGNKDAVTELRRRKHRKEKPLAVMVPHVEFAQRLCHLSAAEEKVLRSVESPIVLLDRLEDHLEHLVCEAVVGANHQLGIMLAYTPVHHLLMRALQNRALVMTSGNRDAEPIAYDNEAALIQLHGIADVFLIHNRPIQTRCDDSVVRVQSDQLGQDDLQTLRRARGYAPDAIHVPQQTPIPILAVGGQLKSTICLLEGHAANLSHHLGDLDEYSAYQAFEDSIDHYEALHQFQPRIIAHDLHPDYASTQYAIERAKSLSVPCIGVQHHEAHVVACLAENGGTGPVIGVAFDGTGYGYDDVLKQPTVWGGEFLVGDRQGFRRAAHLNYVRMPGGEMAIRQPWRMAYSWLSAAGCNSPSDEQLFGPREFDNLNHMISSGLNSPWTSSVGRLFDAVSALLGICTVTSYEGQAACELEHLAARTRMDDQDPFEFQLREMTNCETGTGRDGGNFGRIEVDCRLTMQRIVTELSRGKDRAEIATRFHATIARIIGDTCERIRVREGHNVVALSGGVFMNSLLRSMSVKLLRKSGFEVLCHHRVPPNDGGLSLGQALIAAARVRLGKKSDREACYRT